MNEHLTEFSIWKGQDVGNVTSHGVRLASAGLPIGKDCAVEAIDDLRELSVVVTIDAIISNYLIQYWQNDFVENHALVGCGREDLVELICLIAKRTRPHGKVYGRALDSVGRHDDAAVFTHFAVIAPPASDDDIDVGLFSIGLKLALFTLQGRRSWRPRR
jgi:hypothetical protein